MKALLRLLPYVRSLENEISAERKKHAGVLKAHMALSATAHARHTEYMTELQAHTAEAEAHAKTALRGVEDLKRALAVVDRLAVTLVEQQTTIARLQGTVAFLVERKDTAPGGVRVN